MDPVDELLALWMAECPDPVDLFEDELARRLGLVRHPAMPYARWRRVRVAAIEASGERADLLAAEVEASLDAMGR